MHYFSYGSNLNPEQMRGRCPDHKVVGMAALHEHRLAFPLTSHDWGGGVASVVPSHGTTVWGIVYDLSERDLAELDRYEGYRGPDDQHNLYDRQTVFVELTRPEDGSIPRRVRAWCYFARPSNPAAPSRRYLDAVLAGARHHRLPEEYVAALAKTAASD
jgi:gamma-glutamylcyclotransferase